MGDPFAGGEDSTWGGTLLPTQWRLWEDIIEAAAYDSHTAQMSGIYPVRNGAVVIPQ